MSLISHQDLACLRAHGSECCGSSSWGLAGLDHTPIQMITNSPFLSLYRSLKVWITIIASCVDILLFFGLKRCDIVSMKFLRNVLLITLYWLCNAICSLLESRLAQSWHNEISDVYINNQHHFLINYMLCASIWLKLNFSGLIFLFKWDNRLYKLTPKNDLCILPQYSLWACFLGNYKTTFIFGVCFYDMLYAWLMKAKPWTHSSQWKNSQWLQ